MREHIQHETKAFYETVIAPPTQVVTDASEKMDLEHEYPVRYPIESVATPTSAVASTSDQVNTAWLTLPPRPKGS